MKSAVFIKIVENEYNSMLSDLGGDQELGMENSASELTNEQDNRVERFKQWFKFALGTTEITVGDYNMTPAEVIAYAASRRSEIPPYEPMYPDIRKVVNLHTEEELRELFGPVIAGGLNK